MSAYFLSFVDPSLSHDLTAALGRHEISLLGHSAIEEYAAGYRGDGDVDSGPIVLGASVTATGFAIGAAQASGESELARRLLRTAHVFGVPVVTAAGMRFTVGGPIGNAIMLAEVTARAPRR